MSSGENMEARAKKFHKFFVTLTTAIVIVSPFVAYGLFNNLHKATKVDVTSRIFLEDTLSNESIKYYQGQSISTDPNNYRILDLHPFTDMSLRVGSCTDVQIKEAKLNSKKSLAYLTLIVKGKHFCPNKPQLVISNNEKDIDISQINQLFANNP